MRNEVTIFLKRGYVNMSRVVIKMAHRSKIEF
jgi:hypothetical protein